MDKVGQREGEVIKEEAHYLCENPLCKHEWKEKLANVRCPKCGHKYMKWLNFQERGK